MDHATIFSGRSSGSGSRHGSDHRRPLLAVLLAALACGDGSAMTAGSVTGANGTPEDMGSPAASQSPAETTPATPAAEAPPTPTPTAPANGAAEVAPTPPRLGGEQPRTSSGGAAEEAAGDTPPDGASGSTVAEPTRETATDPGPFPVLTVTAGLRDGPEYGSQTLHVPEGAEPPLAAVAIVPGFNTPESSIQAWGPFLASHGIVALTIGTNSPTDSADVRARAVLDALETIEAENVRSGGPLAGKLALDRLGIMGWSLGGGGVLSAASRTPSLKAAITMAAFGPGAQFPNNQVPTLFLAGSADPNAGGQSQGMFASLPDSTPKMLFEVRGGPHEIGNDPANANGEIGRYGLSWLEVFLVGDERYRQFLEEAPTQASDFRENLTATR